MVVRLGVGGGGQGREFFREIQSSGLAKVHGGEGRLREGYRGLGFLWISDDAVWEPAGEQSHSEHAGQSLEKQGLKDGKHVPHSCW